MLNKMACQDYTILCVEDGTDWKHGSMTREVVMRVDPDLTRTVLVNTKFDTKISQFGSFIDFLDFIRADLIDKLYPRRLG